MTRKQMIPHLQRWESCQRQAEVAWSSLESVTGYTDSESPLGKAVWGTFADYTATLADLIGDNSGWLEWFHLENHMGSRGMEVSLSESGPVFAVRTIQDLARIIATP
jgi:hypothetical protein